MRNAAGVPPARAAACSTPSGTRNQPPRDAAALSYAYSTSVATFTPASHASSQWTSNVSRNAYAVVMPARVARNVKNR